MKNTTLILVLVFFVNFSSYSQNQDGEFKEYYSNDQIKEITNYKNGVKDGVYSRYLKNGVLINEGSYRNGEKIGIWKRYYANKALDQKIDFDKGEIKYFLPNGSLIQHNQGDYIDNNTIIDDGIRTNYDGDGAITGKTEIYDLLKSYKTYHSNGKLKQEYLYALIKDTIVSIDPKDFDPKQLSKITKPDLKNGLLTLRKKFFSKRETIRIDYDDKGDFSSSIDFQLDKGYRLARERKYEEAMPYFLRSLTCGNLLSNEYY